MATQRSKAVTGTPDPDVKAPWEDGFDPETDGKTLGQVNVTDSGQDVATVAPQTAQARYATPAKVAEWVRERGLGERTRDVIVYIASKVIDTGDLNAVIMERLMARMLDSDDADAVLDPFGTIKGQDMIGKPLNVVGAEFLEGDFEESFPWYVSLMVQDPATGGVMPVTTGGEKLVLQAAVLDMKEKWPLMVKIVQSDKPTRSGYYPLELRWAHK
jgi:hypothetical protein